MARQQLTAMTMLKYELCKLPFRIARMQAQRYIKKAENNIVSSVIANEGFDSEEEATQFAQEVIDSQKSQELQNEFEAEKNDAFSEE